MRILLLFKLHSTEFHFPTHLFTFKNHDIASSKQDFILGAPGVKPVRFLTSRSLSWFRDFEMNTEINIRCLKL